MILPDPNHPFLRALQQRILILDGAMGTFIQDEGLTGNNDEFSRSHPEVIKSIHRRYLEAGADVIETNTFSANRISQADYGLEDECYAMNLAAATLAKEVASEYSAFVAGAIGPTNRTASMSPEVEDPGARNVTFEQLVEAYAEQAAGLIDGGCDLLLVETVFDTLNCKAALFAISDVFEERGAAIPVIVSGTITDDSGRTLSGQTVEAFYNSISHFPLAAVGFNCALGPSQLRPHMQSLAEMATCNISCYPNAGLPNEFGEYDLSPNDMAEQIAEFANAGFLNLVGGCCGTTPQHIAAMKDALSGLAPRAIPVRDNIARYSGLELFSARENINFINVGERCNVSGSRRFARLIREEKYEEALAVARMQVDDGAQILDVCMDEGLLESASSMRIFLNQLSVDPDICRVPIMIDSSDWQVIEEGLKCIQGRCIVNSISLKDGEKVFLERAQLAKKYGAAVVIMAFDETGQAVDAQSRVAIVSRSIELLQSVGMRLDEMIFDLNVLAIATGMEEHDDYARTFIDATQQLCEKYPQIVISGGISNISFSFRGAEQVRQALHSVFLQHAIAAGMRMGIVHAGQLANYHDLAPELRELATAVIFNTGSDAGDNLLEWAKAHDSDSAVIEREVALEEWRSLAVDERLAHALVSGIDQYLLEDLPVCLEGAGSALAVIEGALMNGMNEVGDLFGSGRMFLPQVVKSARVMKKAVAWLQPYLEKDQAQASHRGTVLLATVKGDVHDIGKNITGVVLECNGYKVIDLGVMVSCETILQQAIECQADLIGLSGLITPSLKEMVHVASEVKRLGIETPLLIGGATTSLVHTAVKIAPETSSAVVYVLDASRAVGVVGALLGSSRDAFLATNKERQLQAVARRAQQQAKPTLALAEARQRAYQCTQPAVNAPQFTGSKKLDSLPLDEIRGWIDWRQFYTTWDIKSSDKSLAAQQQRETLLSDAKQLLDEIIDAKALRATATFGFWKAQSHAETITLKDSANVKPFTFSRQLRDAGAQRANRCLADFIAPEDSDHLGAFALTAGLGLPELLEEAESQQDDYRKIMLQAVADRLAEASAEWLHAQVRTKYWGYAPDEELSEEDIIGEQYQGIRPAPGYPACPNHALKTSLFELLGGEQHLEISLTSSLAMDPPASICGFYFAHPEAHYFGVGSIDES